MENKEVKKLIRRLKGIVTSDKMDKTAVVEVTRLKKEPRYKKFYKVSTKYKAHDAENQFKVGDEVIIELTRPMSKDKRWLVVEKVK